MNFMFSKIFREKSNDRDCMIVKSNGGELVYAPFSECTRYRLLFYLHTFQFSQWRTLLFQSWNQNESSTPHYTSGPTAPSPISSSLRFSSPKPLTPFHCFSMASNVQRNGAQRGSAKFDRPLKPRPRASSPSPGSLRRPASATRNDAG